MTCHRMPGGELRQSRLVLRAARHRERAPRMKPAAALRVEGARHLAGQHDLFPRLVGDETAATQRTAPCIRMERIGTKLEAVGGLHQLAEIYDPGPPARVRDGDKIVRDKQELTPRRAWMSCSKPMIWARIETSSADTLVCCLSIAKTICFGR